MPSQSQPQAQPAGTPVLLVFNGVFRVLCHICVLCVARQGLRDEAIADLTMRRAWPGQQRAREYARYWYLSPAKRTCSCKVLVPFRLPTAENGRNRDLRCLFASFPSAGSTGQPPTGERHRSCPPGGVWHESTGWAAWLVRRNPSIPHSLHPTFPPLRLNRRVSRARANTRPALVLLCLWHVTGDVYCISLHSVLRTPYSVAPS